MSKLAFSWLKDTDRLTLEQGVKGEANQNFDSGYSSPYWPPEYGYIMLSGYWVQSVGIQVAVDS